LDLVSNYFGEDFWDLATIEYDPVRTGRETQYLITRFAELTPNRRILDLCCGQGRHAADLINANFEVVGTDTSHRALSIARMAAPAATFHNFDVFAPGWPVRSNFGGAMLIQSCGWVSDGLLLATLRRIRRCLAADGILVLDVSVSPWIHRNFITEAALESGNRTYRFDRRFDAEASVVVGSLNVSDGAKERQYPHRVRVYDLPTIRQLVTAAQYSVIAIDADFEIGRLPTIDTRYAQLICRPLHVHSSVSRWADSQTANPPAALDLTAIPDEPNYAQPSSREAWAETVKCAEDWEVSRAYHADDPFCSRLSADLGKALQIDIRADQVVAGAGITSLLNACARFATGRTLLHGACDHTDLVVWPHHSRGEFSACRRLIQPTFAPRSRTSRTH
jgi:SAM-dependent methyltransferase